MRRHPVRHSPVAGGFQFPASHSRFSLHSIVEWHHTQLNFVATCEHDSLSAAISLHLYTKAGERNNFLFKLRLQLQIWLFTTRTMNIVGVIEWIPSIPDNGQWRGYIRRMWWIWKFDTVTVNCIAKKLGVCLNCSPFNRPPAPQMWLNEKFRRRVFEFNANQSPCTRCHKNFVFVAETRYFWAKCWPRPECWSDRLENSNVTLNLWAFASFARLTTKPAMGTSLPQTLVLSVQRWAFGHQLHGNWDVTHCVHEVKGSQS